MILLILYLAAAILTLGTAVGVVYWGTSKMVTALECDSKVKLALAESEAEKVRAAGSFEATRYEAQALELKEAMEEVDDEISN